MTNLTEKFMELKMQLILELRDLDAQIEKLKFRRVELNSALYDELDFAADPAGLLELADPNDPNVMTLARFLYDNPGSSREAINKLFEDTLTSTQTKNLVAKCSKRNVIVNNGPSKQKSEWYVSF